MLLPLSNMAANVPRHCLLTIVVIIVVIVVPRRCPLGRHALQPTAGKQRGRDQRSTGQAGKQAGSGSAAAIQSAVAPKQELRLADFGTQTLGAPHFM